MDQSSSRDVHEAGHTSAHAEVGPGGGVLSGIRQAELFGVSYFRGTLEDATAVVIDSAVSERGGYACLCNVHVLETAHRDPRVMAALDDARVVFPDGTPIVWAQRASYRDGAPFARIAGPDLMERVLRDGRAYGMRHALYGSTEDVVGRLRATVAHRYPGAQIVVAVTPPFGEQTEEEVRKQVEAIRASRPHVVWVALGAPRQELWAATYASSLQPAFVVAVGAAFDFLAGVKPRAPRWMRRAGLEWLHRLSLEPARLGRRYVTTNTTFLLRAASSLVRRRRPAAKRPRS